MKKIKKELPGIDTKDTWKGVLMIILVTGIVALGLATEKKAELVSEEGEMFAPTGSQPDSYELIITVNNKDYVMFPGQIIKFQLHHDGMGALELIGGASPWNDYKYFKFSGDNILEVTESGQIMKVSSVQEMRTALTHRNPDQLRIETDRIPEAAFSGRTRIDNDNSFKITYRKLGSPRTQALINAQQDAVGLYNAMTGLGTYEDAIFDILYGKTKEEIQLIKEQFKIFDPGKRELEDTLRSELSGNELKTALTYLEGTTSKPQYELYIIANGKRDMIKVGETIEFIYTKDGIYLDPPTWKVHFKFNGDNTFIKTKKSIQTVHSVEEVWRAAVKPGASVELSTKGLGSVLGNERVDTDEGFTVIYKDLANNLEIKLPTRVMSDAKILVEAMDGVGTDEDAIFYILQIRSKNEINQIDSEYNKIVGRSLEEAFRRELSGNDLRRARTYLKGDINKFTEDALKLDKAMTGVGTDEAAIFEVLEGKTKEEIDQIKAEYSDIIGGQLELHLMVELSGTDEIKARAYLKYGNNIFTEHTLKLYIAMAGAGTDEAAIFEVLEGKTKDEISQIKARYFNIIGRRLEQDLRGELSGTDLTKALKYLEGTIMISTDLQEQKEIAAKEYAEKLYTAMAGAGTDEAAIFKVLKGRSNEELIWIQGQYYGLYHEDLIDDLKSELSGADLTKALAYLKGGIDIFKEYALKLNKAMVGAGTDEAAIFEVLKGKTKDEISQIKAKYLEITGRSLETDLRGELSGADLEKALKYLEGTSLFIKIEPNQFVYPWEDVESDKELGTMKAIDDILALDLSIYSGLSRKLSGLYDEKGHLVIFIIKEALPSEKDLNNLLTSLKNRAKEDKKKQEPIIIIYTYGNGKINFKTDSKYSSIECIPCSLKSVKEATGLEISKKELTNPVEIAYLYVGMFVDTLK